MWLGLIQSVERPYEQTLRFPREETLSQALSINACLSFQPAGLPYNLGLASSTTV